MPILCFNTPRPIAGKANPTFSSPSFLSSPAGVCAAGAGAGAGTTADAGRVCSSSGAGLTFTEN